MCAFSTSKLLMGGLPRKIVRGLEKIIRGDASYWNAVYLLRFRTVGPKLVARMTDCTNMTLGVE